MLSGGGKAPRSGFVTKHPKTVRALEIVKANPFSFG
jgi:hypothetical protein